MTDIFVDESLVAHLHYGKDYLRLRDEAGNVVGYFLPIDPALTETIPMTGPARREDDQAPSCQLEN